MDSIPSDAKSLADVRRALDQYLAPRVCLVCNAMKRPRWHLLRNEERRCFEVIVWACDRCNNWDGEDARMVAVGIDVPYPMLRANVDAIEGLARR